MALNPDYVGRTFEASAPYEVSRVKIAEFATAIGETSPLCFDKQAAEKAGYPDVIAPPTFAIVVSSAGSSKVITDKGLGLNYAMVVHGEQRFEYRRPLHAGRTIDHGLARTPLPVVMSANLRVPATTNPTVDLVGPRPEGPGAQAVGAQYPSRGKPTPDMRGAAATPMPLTDRGSRQSLPADAIPLEPLQAAIQAHGSMVPPCFGIPPRSFTRSVPGEGENW